VKQTAIEALGKSSSPDTTSTLIHLLSDDESQIRKAAALALGQIGSHDAINALIRLLTDDESEVRKAAALALGQIGSSDATYALTRLFTDDESWDQNAAAQALQQIGSPDAVPLLLSEMCRRGTYTEEVRTLAGDFQTTAEGLRLTITSNDVHPAARALAVQHVGFYHDDEELLSILRDITKEDPDAEVRKAASRAAVAYWEKLNLLARVRGDE
jgi:HEAT repeat protein